MGRLGRGLSTLAIVGAFLAPASGAWAADSNDELLFYDDNGLYRFYDVGTTGGLGSPFMGGPNYTRGWDSITSVDLDGDSRDEVLYYREDGLFAFYRLNEDGTLGPKVHGGTNYTRGWDSIVGMDLDGDARDELLFYREDGLYAFYDVTATGGLSAKLRGGTNYTRGWDSIVGLDLDGDAREEALFYREDGLYAFFDMTTTGGTSTKLRGGTNYTRGWDSITALDLDGDQRDELLFYRSHDGLYGYFDVSSSGSMASKIRGGNYTAGWDIIMSLDAGDPPASPVVPNPSPAVTFGDGTRRVGGSLPAGTYRTTSSTLDFCYWERLSGLSGEYEDVITAYGSGVRTIVTIEPGDYAFSSSGCGTWTNQFPQFWRSPTSALPGGDYFVGAEVMPGQWTASNPTDSCYWERLSGFKGYLEEILANEFTGDPTAVYIEESDVGFRSEGCGTWVYQGR